MGGYKKLKTVFLVLSHFKMKIELVNRFFSFLCVSLAKENN